MRRESRNLVKFVESCGPIDHINLEVYPINSQNDNTPTVNCVVFGSQITSRYVKCHRGIFVSAKQKASEVATELWAYYSSRNMKVNMNDLILAQRNNSFSQIAI